jgi:hypothetical protein
MWNVWLRPHLSFYSSKNRVLFLCFQDTRHLEIERNFEVVVYPNGNKWIMDLSSFDRLTISEHLGETKIEHSCGYGHQTVAKTTLVEQAWTTMAQGYPS